VARDDFGDNKAGKRLSCCGLGKVERNFKIEIIVDIFLTDVNF